MTHHPLNDAYSRLNRASEHLESLKVAHTAFIDAENKIAEDNPEFDTSKVPASVSFKPVEKIPTIIPILVGEVAYHLRGALDFLVYELAVIDSGAPCKGSQFPIEGTPEGFRGRRKSFLNGISDAHVAAIEKLQPCAGTKWTAFLRNVSNPEKLRHFTVAQPASFVALDDGSPIIDTLETVHAAVRYTLDTFKPEFK